MDVLAFDLAALQKRLENLSGVVVAFSGGVDSAVLLAVALETLGTARVLAVIADSPSLARAELWEARALALSLGAELMVLPTQEMDDPRYRANTGNRCFWCKEELFSLAGREAKRRSWALAYGENAEDHKVDRPGAQSAARRGVLAPLRDAGWTKAAVRAFARTRHLSVAEKPAAPCLASRVAVGVPVSLDVLQRVEALEADLRQRNYRVLRARHLAPNRGILEFGKLDFFRAQTEKEDLLALAAEHGYSHCHIQIYQSGSVAAGMGRTATTNLIDLPGGGIPPANVDNARAPFQPRHCR